MGDGTLVLQPPPLYAEADQANISQPPPWVRPTYDSIFFDAVGIVALPANGAAAVVVVSFEVPPQYNGLVHWLSNIFLGGGFIDGSGSVIWQYLVNGIAVQNYEQVLWQNGSTPQPTETFIPVPGGATVEVTVATATTPPPVGAQSICRLKGWYWPLSYQSS